MIKEILKIIPKLDSSELGKMEKSLNSRFTRVAKNFGKKLGGFMKGGAVAAAAGALVARLVNPLKETEEAIIRTLTRADDLSTNAGQFQTSTGNLAKLVGLGESTGLDPQALYTILGKFQSAVARAAVDPSKKTAVSNFTSNPDVAESFVGFLTELKKLTPQQQTAVQYEVFGDKQILKMSEFLNLNFASKIKELGFDKLSTKKLGDSVDKLGGLSDRRDTKTARFNTMDLVAKGGLINNSMVDQMAMSEKRKLDLENERLLDFDNIKAIAETAKDIEEGIEKGFLAISGAVRTVTDKLSEVVEFLGKAKKSSIFRGIFGKGD